MVRTKDQSKNDAIIKAALKLVNELGFTGISMSKIAKEAEISPATIYIHFKNQEDLFTRLYINIRKEMSREALKNIHKGMTLKEEFISIWSKSFKFNLKHPEYIIYRERFEQTVMMNNVSLKQFELYLHIGNLFKRGISKNILKSLPLPMLTAFAFYPSITLLKFHFGDLIKMDETLINEACEIAWRAISKES